MTVPTTTAVAMIGPRARTRPGACARETATSGGRDGSAVMRVSIRVVRQGRGGVGTAKHTRARGNCERKYGGRVQLRSPRQLYTRALRSCTGRPEKPGNLC